MVILNSDDIYEYISVTEPVQIRNESVPQDRLGKDRSGQESEGERSTGKGNLEKPVTTAASGGALSETDREKNFLLFWDMYPKKIDREETQKVFMEIQEDFETIMEGLRHHRKCNQWVSDNGTFIPDPKNWLKKKAWNNRPPLYVPKKDVVPNGSEAASGRLGPEELAAIRRVLSDPC